MVSFSMHLEGEEPVDLEHAAAAVVVLLDERERLPRQCNTASYNATYCTVLYCTVLHCTALHCTALCCAVLYCAVLCCAVLCESTGIQAPAVVPWHRHPPCASLRQEGGRE